MENRRKFTARSTLNQTPHSGVLVVQRPGELSLNMNCFFFFAFLYYSLKTRMDDSSPVHQLEDSLFEIQYLKS